MRNQIAVSGATGFVGKEIITALEKETTPYLRLIRQPKIENTTTDVLFDLEKPHLLQEAFLKDVKCVIHSAALVHNKLDPAQNVEQQYEQYNVKATEILVEKSLQAGVEHVIFISTVAVYGVSSSKNKISCFASENPTSLYGKSKLKAEKAIKDLLSNKSMNFTIIRLPLVYGPSAPGNLSTIQTISKKNIPLPFLKINNKRSMVLVKHVADFVLHAISSHELKNKTLLFCDGSEFSTNEIVSSMRKTLNKKHFLFPFPKIFMKIVLSILGKKEMYQQLYEDLQFECSPEVLNSGWKPKYELDITSCLKQYNDS